MKKRSNKINHTITIIRKFWYSDNKQKFNINVSTDIVPAEAYDLKTENQT
jgi:hypothetical protein